MGNIDIILPALNINYNTLNQRFVKFCLNRILIASRQYFSRVSYVLFIAVQPTTPIPVYYTFSERFNNHLKAPSSIYSYLSTTRHPATLDNFSTVTRDRQSFARAIKEPLYRRVNNPMLNKNTDKYDLPSTWDGALVNTPKFKIKN